jgi:ectoine hydroxylase-related dioxygenase (phytanoyl-CoA dioxygenase family)
MPHPQKYEAGYLVAGVPAFQDYFDQHHVQLPLKKGDGIFFNPALLPAAGHNRSTDIRRMANQLHVSSAFGRCMETVDRVRMAQALCPSLLQARACLQRISKPPWPLAPKAMPFPRIWSATRP